MDDNPTSIPLRFLVKNILVEWFLSSTAHAIPNIFRTGSVILKIIWTCCLLASASYCFYSVIQSINDFLSYPSYISTRIVQEIPTPFPAVTVCNLKTVNKTVAKAYLDVLVSYLPPVFFSSPFERITAQQYAVRTQISNDTTLGEEGRKQLGFQMKHMLVSCMFNYRPCDADDFTYSYNPVYGNCYTFNKGVADDGTTKSIKQISISDTMYGLIMEFYLGQPTKETYLEFADGVVISVNNQSFVSFTEDGKKMAAAGAETDIIVSRNFINKLEKPYGDCLKDVSKSTVFSSQLFDYIVRTLEIAYSQKYCFGLCIQSEIIKNCNCSNTFMPVFKENTRYCIRKSEIDCFTTLVNNFGQQKDAIANCQSACPFSCETIEYETSSYSSYYPTDYYKTVLLESSLIKDQSNISEANIGRAVAKVNVYYKSMSYLLIEEKVSTSTETFFSNIGGTLGLYLGISMLSIVEVVELAFNLVYAVCNYKKQQKAVDVEQIDVKTEKQKVGNKSKKSLTSVKL